MTPSVDCSQAATVTRRSSWLIRHNSALTLATAGVPPVIYLLFINRFAVNSFYNDDWSVVPMVHAALHGHVSLGQLWSQHNESRLLMGNVTVVLFGLIDRLDLRAVIFFSAVVLIASYGGLLILLRRYLGKRFTPIPVLIVGIIWFSLCDVENAFWAFQVSWYLTLLFFVMVLVALLIPDNHRRTWLSLAIFLALVAAFTTIQGFLCWPIGAVCLLWNRAWTRRARTELTVWLGTALVALAVYLPGYSFSTGQGATCLNPKNCTIAVLVHHPLTAPGFFIALIGNVIPSVPGTTTIVHNLIRFELVGGAILAAAIFILLQSWRHRSSSEQMPLPLLLISFALLFDLTITIGRGATGISQAVIDNRFIMANLVLVTGMAIYAWNHVPWHSMAMAHGPWPVSRTYLALCVFTSFLIVQTITATDFGLTNGSVIRGQRSDEAQFVVYLERNPVLSFERTCQEYSFFLPPKFKLYLREAVAGQLGEFNPGSDRHFDELGPPPAPSACRARKSITSGVAG